MGASYPQCHVCANRPDRVRLGSPPCGRRRSPAACETLMSPTTSALTALGVDDQFGEDCILHCIARSILKDDAILRNCETLEQPRCDRGLRGAVIHQRAAAARKQDAGIGVTPCQVWDDGQALALVEHYLMAWARCIYHAAKNNDPVRR